jgi:hypothetical protein
LKPLTHLLITIGCQAKKIKFDFNFMKRLIRLFIWTAILFGVITILTIKYEIMIDGNNTIGFPLTFHTTFSDFCIDCTNQTMNNYLNLVIDILIIIPVAIGIDYGILKIRKIIAK